MLPDLGVIAARLAPIAQRARANQNYVAGFELGLLRGQGFAQIIHGDGVIARQGIKPFRAGDINQHAARDDQRNRRRVGFAYAPVAASIAFLKAVVPMIVVTGGDVAESVNLGGDVVVDE